MDEFLNAKASLTPAVAGAMTTTFTGTLASQFGLPGNWTGLIFSFALGLFVFQHTKAGLSTKLLLYVVNSLTIFAVAMGLNSAGVAASRNAVSREFHERQVRSLEQAPESRPFFQDWW